MFLRDIYFCLFLEPSEKSPLELVGQKRVGTGRTTAGPGDRLLDAML